MKNGPEWPTSQPRCRPFVLSGDRLSQTLNKNENEKGETDEQDEHEEVHGQHL